jgi:hypothetical protein
MGDLAGEPFAAAYLAPPLTAAYDELIGPGRWERSVRPATWPHRGAGPRMIAQPAVSAPGGFVLDGSDTSPVARAIVKGLAMAD